jgi:S-adenosylmethionine:tRNA ribosyltransferase-isomerase
MLVTTRRGHQHATFRDIRGFLNPGDVLVVNISSTIPASLPATGSIGPFLLNLSTDFGAGLWLAEPRWGVDQPGPLPLHPGETIRVAGKIARLISPYPGIERLWWVHFPLEISHLLKRYGRPIRYGYLDREFPLDAYQTLFSRIPGSAEMPSAGRPFTKGVLEQLTAGGVQIAEVVLHTGVSSLELEPDPMDASPIYPEPYHVPHATALAVNQARARGSKVVAVGTTTVKALESAWADEQVRASSGFTRLFLHPGRGVKSVNGLLTGLHDPRTTHLALLTCLIDPLSLRSAYQEAIREGYLWHEFGDSHLILP